MLGNNVRTPKNNLKIEKQKIQKEKINTEI